MGIDLDKYNKGGNIPFWWWDSYICWNCRLHNGIKNNPKLIKLQRLDRQEKSNKFYASRYTYEPFSFFNKYDRIKPNQYQETQKPKFSKNTNGSFVETGRICYKCHNQMVNVGLKFKPPKKTDVKKWKHLEKTWRHQSIYVNGEKKYVGPKERVVQQSF